MKINTEIETAKTKINSLEIGIESDTKIALDFKDKVYKVEEKAEKVDEAMQKLKQDLWIQWK